MKSGDVTTLKDVAEVAGVSIDTVSRVLNGKGKVAWPSALRRAKEIRQIAERMNYRPNAAARAVRSARTRMVGALLRNNPRDPHIHPVSFETLLGLNHGLEAAGYVLSMVPFDDREFFADAAGSRFFREQMLDGMVLIGGIPEAAIERLEELVRVSILADTNVWREQRCIRRDEVETGRTVAESLLKLGYRRLVLLGGGRSSVPHYSRDDRERGLRQAAELAGTAVERIDIPWTAVIDPAILRPDLLDRSVAIVTEGTEWAHWLAHAANRLGKVPGRDFGLACCDESNEVCRYWPGLSRVCFDHYAMGIEAAEMMLQGLEQPDAPCPSKKFKGEWRPGDTAQGPHQP